MARNRSVVIVYFLAIPVSSPRARPTGLSTCCAVSPLALPGVGPRLREGQVQGMACTFAWGRCAVFSARAEETQPSHFPPSWSSPRLSASFPEADSHA